MGAVVHKGGPRWSWETWAGGPGAGLDCVVYTHSIVGHGDGVSGGPLTSVMPPRPLLCDHSPGLGLHKGPATHLA